MLEDKHTQIERNNQRLFERMKKLLDKSKPSKFIPLPILKNLGPTSLHQPLMKREKQRIDEENNRFLQRLQHIRSGYTANIDHISSKKSLSHQKSLENLESERTSFL